MAKKDTQPKKPVVELKKLNFLIGKWHSQGKILQGAATSSKNIRGMDSYEWVAGGSFILHRVDVFMGDQRTEAIEIIGYDEDSKSYFMRSFDSDGSSITMYAVLERAGVLKFGDNKMRSVLTANKNGRSMKAKWELSKNGKTWTAWMNIRFDK